KYVDILRGKDVEVLFVPFENADAVGVKGPGPDPGPALEPPFHPALELCCRVIRESDRQDLLRLGVSALNQPGDAFDQDCGLPGSSAGQHQHGTGDVLDGRLLLRVGSKFCRHGTPSALCENKAKTAMGKMRKLRKNKKKSGHRDIGSSEIGTWNG